MTFSPRAAALVKSSGGEPWAENTTVEPSGISCTSSTVTAPLAFERADHVGIVDNLVLHVDGGAVSLEGELYDFDSSDDAARRIRGVHRGRLSWGASLVYGLDVKALPLAAGRRRRPIIAPIAAQSGAAFTGLHFSPVGLFSCHSELAEESKALASQVAQLLPPTQ